MTSPSAEVSHWANQYIGMPWAKGAQGPDAFDCWAFVRFVSKRHFNRLLPTVDVDASNLLLVTREFKNSAERENWRLLDSDEPREDGDAVLMAHSKYPSHVGVWLNVDGGGTLHCVQHMGVVFSDKATLMRNGWGHIEFYRYIGK